MRSNSLRVTYVLDRMSGWCYPEARRSSLFLRERMLLSWSSVVMRSERTVSR